MKSYSNENWHTLNYIPQHPKIFRKFGMTYNSLGESWKRLAERPKEDVGELSRECLSGTSPEAA